MFIRSSILASAVLVVLGLNASADEMRGIISKVDRDHHQLVVSGRGRLARGKEFAFRLAPETKILLSKKAAKVEELKPGQRVRVQFDNRAGQDVAVQVSAMPRGAALRAGMEKAEGYLRMLDWLMQQRQGAPPGP